MTNEVVQNKPWASGPAEILQHAFSLLHKNEETANRLAFLSVDNSIELMVKAYLGLPKRITGLTLSKSRYEEIADSFPRLLEELEKLAPTRVQGIDLAAIEWLHRVRNQLYHQGNGLEIAKEKVALYAQLARLLYEQLFDIELKIADSEATSLVSEFITEWVDLYKTLQLMAGKRLGEEFLSSTRSINEKLAADGYLDRSTEKQIDDLRRIRNAVVHGDLQRLNRPLIEHIKALTARLKWQWETGNSRGIGHQPAKDVVGSSAFRDHNAENRSSVERQWYYTEDGEHSYFLAMVNAKGNSSMRTFDAGDGRFLGKRYKQGRYQDGFKDHIQNSRGLHLSRRPSLERECRERLPEDVLTELQSQIPASSVTDG
jgi:hypothetical protein